MSGMTDDRMDQATPEYAAIIERDRAYDVMGVDLSSPMLTGRMQMAADRRALIALVREMWAALDVVTANDPELLSRALLDRTAPFQEPEEHPE